MCPSILTPSSSAAVVLDSAVLHAQYAYRNPQPSSKRPLKLPPRRKMRIAHLSPSLPKLRPDVTMGHDVGTVILSLTLKLQQ